MEHNENQLAFTATSHEAAYGNSRTLLSDH